MSCFYLTPKEDDFNYLDFLLAIGNLDDLPGEGIGRGRCPDDNRNS